MEVGKDSLELTIDGSKMLSKSLVSDDGVDILRGEALKDLVEESHLGLPCLSDQSMLSLSQILTSLHLLLLSLTNVDGDFSFVVSRGALGCLDVLL